MLKNKKKLIILGSGGHAKILLEILEKNKNIILGVCCPNLKSLNQKIWRDLPVLGDDNYLENVDRKSVKIVNGVGYSNTDRKKIFNKIKRMGFNFKSIVHPEAIISKYARISEGSQVLAGAIIQTDSLIGINSIINTGAQIDHDCIIGNHCHIAPGCILCGHVTISDMVFLGCGSTVVPGVQLHTQKFYKANSIIK